MGVQSALKLSEISYGDLIQIGTADSADLYWTKFPNGKLILVDRPYWLQRFSHNGDANVPITQYKYGTNFYPNCDIHKYLNSSDARTDDSYMAYARIPGFLCSFSQYVRKRMRPFDITCEVPKGYTRKYGVSPVKIENVMAAVASIEEFQGNDGLDAGGASFITRTPWNDDHSFKTTHGCMIHSANHNSYNKIAVTIKLDGDTEMHKEPMNRRYWYRGNYVQEVWKITDPSDTVVADDWKKLFPW